MIFENIEVDLEIITVLAVVSADIKNLAQSWHNYITKYFKYGSITTVNTETGATDLEN